jgi:uncharacterized repeat protein (TIGR03803 family)
MEKDFPAFFLPDSHRDHTARNKTFDLPTSQASECARPLRLILIRLDGKENQPMHSQARSLNSLFRTISLAMIAVSVMAVAMFPAWAQNSVPPTAVQAARMPEFASKLAYPVKRPGPSTSRALARARMHPGPLQANDIYDNGPTNGNTDAWTINFGFITSDSFNVTQGNNTSITGMSFAAWMAPGDVLDSAEVSITSSENGGTSYFDQIVNFTQSGCIGNEFGYNVCTQTASFTGPTLNNGTYWVNLQNASSAAGDPVYWDENSGPSQASENTVGTIPSESFTILGSTTTSTSTSCSVDSQGPAHELYDLGEFTGSNQPSGVAIGRAGNLYGTLSAAGSQAQGLLYELARGAVTNWFFSSLYSFLGGSNGSSPNGVIVGPEGVLYGAAVGGIQNCAEYESTYCGVIYEARPGPAACATALCGWNETTIYEFTSLTDAWGGTVTAFDSGGNLYGISGGNGYFPQGGAYGQGAIFELTPSQGSWTEKILYSFTGGNDGAGPTSLLLGGDGNLYGTARGGGLSASGVVFQLVPSAGGWTENVLYNFSGGATDGGYPGELIQDSHGNFYGFSECDITGGGCGGWGYWGEGLIFELSSSGGGFNVIYNSIDWCPSQWSSFSALTVDPTGNLYAAAAGYGCNQNGCNYDCTAVGSVPSNTPLIWGQNFVFGNLTSDAKGNLYGTTDTCAFGNPTDGMVWQYSP